jgi:hypothetical protein
MTLLSEVGHDEELILRVVLRYGITIIGESIGEDWDKGPRTPRNKDI